MIKHMLHHAEPSWAAPKRPASCRRGSSTAALQASPSLDIPARSTRHASQQQAQLNNKSQQWVQPPVLDRIAEAFTSTSSALQHDLAAAERCTAEVPVSHPAAAPLCVSHPLLGPLQLASVSPVANMQPLEGRCPESGSVHVAHAGPAALDAPGSCVGRMQPHRDRILEPDRSHVSPAERAPLGQRTAAHHATHGLHCSSTAQEHELSAQVSDRCSGAHQAAHGPWTRPIMAPPSSETSTQVDFSPLGADCQLPATYFPTLPPSRNLMLPELS